MCNLAAQVTWQLDLKPALLTMQHCIAWGGWDQRIKKIKRISKALLSLWWQSWTLILWHSIICQVNNSAWGRLWMFSGIFCRTRERISKGMPGLLWTDDVCFWVCQLSVWSSWAVRAIVEFGRWSGHYYNWTLTFYLDLWATAQKCDSL